MILFSIGYQFASILHKTNQFGCVFPFWLGQKTIKLNWLSPQRIYDWGSFLLYILWISVSWTMLGFIGNEPCLLVPATAATAKLNTLPFYHSFWNNANRPSLERICYLTLTSFSFYLRYTNWSLNLLFITFTLFFSFSHINNRLWQRNFLKCLQLEKWGKFSLRTVQKPMILGFFFFQTRTSKGRKETIEQKKSNQLVHFVFKNI